MAKVEHNLPTFENLVAHFMRKPLKVFKEVLCCCLTFDEKTRKL